MPSRSLEDLHPIVREKVIEFKDLCAKEGIDVLITCTYRSAKEQDDLYAQGRTKPGRIVTNAKGGQSWHQWRVAFDFVPIINGKAQWNDIETFNRCGLLAEQVGLEWAGRWKSFKELAHCQQTFGLSIADFKAGKSF
jgi:peptidoglycan L-alanyl-D-glutamate endopeptidase CwlK